ncbi:MAG: enterobactin/ferric enterobactin esterase [Candidatus Izimaplasma bacterium HR2]|nr:MAG: enterobactin/ferric enterobactin esterase [Candidatus Izimaplasma bacterium HR2]
MNKYKIFKIKSKELRREVVVSVYTPKSYETSDFSYPVLYMHDGQNLFDDNLATYGKSWGIIDTYENDPSLPEIIIVGIDSIDTRTDELVPYKFIEDDDKEPVGGKAECYYDFITKNLKPIIDKNYRTLKSEKHTGVMGSSYGGLSSTYAAAKYPEFFTRFGCVSNAYYPNQDEIEKLLKNSTFPTCKKFYMDSGTKEIDNEKHSKQYLKSNQSVYDILSGKIEPDKLKYMVIKDAIHNEAAWGIRFPNIIKFLFSDTYKK